MVKRFLATLLALAMLVSMSTVAFAAEDVKAPSNSVNAEIVPFAGTEVWDKTEAYVGIISMDGNNLTPVKTIGRDSNLLTIYSEGQRVVANPNCKMEIQVRKAYTNTVLASSGKQMCSGWNYISVSLNVPKGTKIQVYFRLYDLNGNYQDEYHATFGYWYKYT